MLRFLTVAVLSLLLVACGGDSEPPTPTPTKTPVAQEAAVVAVDTPSPAAPTETLVVIAAATPVPATDTPVVIALVPTDTPMPVLPTDTPAPLPTEPPAVPAEALPVDDVSRSVDAQIATVGSVVIVAVDKGAEYVDVQNQGAEAVDLSGWRLLSVKGYQECWLGGAIQPGETLRIWALTGDGGFNCQFDGNIWNNSESDPAELYDATGNLVSTW